MFKLNRARDISRTIASIFEAILQLIVLAATELFIKNHYSPPHLKIFRAAAHVKCRDNITVNTNDSSRETRHTILSVAACRKCIEIHIRINTEQVSVLNAQRCTRGKIMRCQFLVIWRRLVSAVIIS